MNIEDQKPSLVLDGDWVRKCRSPGVYVIYKDSEVMYVGSSRVGALTRCVSSSHHQSNCITQCTRIEIYLCESVDKCLELEKRLINDLKPTHNSASVIAKQSLRARRTKPVQRMSNADNERMRSMFVDGYSMSRIAHEIGVTKQAISGKIRHWISRSDGEDKERLMSILEINKRQNFTVNHHYCHRGDKTIHDIKPSA